MRRNHYHCSCIVGFAFHTAHGYQESCQEDNHIIHKVANNGNIVCWCGCGCDEKTIKAEDHKLQIPVRRPATLCLNIIAITAKRIKTPNNSHF